MKKNLLFCMLIVISAIGFSQTYPVQDVDECVFLTEGFLQNATYTASVTNPDGGDASANVSSITPTTPGNTTTFSTYFTLPYSISTGTVLSLSIRHYSASASATSGTFRVSLSRSGVTGGFFIIGSSSNNAGEWTTTTFTDFTATSGNTTNDANIDAAGGYNTIVIQKLKLSIRFEWESKGKGSFFALARHLNGSVKYIYQSFDQS